MRPFAIKASSLTGRAGVALVGGLRYAGMQASATNQAQGLRYGGLTQAQEEEAK